MSIHPGTAETLSAAPLDTRDAGDSVASGRPWSIDTAIPLLPTDEESDLRDAIRSLLASAGDIEDVRRITESELGYSSEVWSELATSMAVTTMAVPESDGGLGYGLTYLCTVLEECGRALRPEPVLTSAAVGVHALLLGSDARLDQHRAAALDGRAVVTATPLDSDTDCLTAFEISSGDWRLSGTAAHAPHGATADIAVVTAETGSGRRLFAVPLTDDAVTRVTAESIDPTRPLAVLHLDTAAAIPLSAEGDTAALLSELRARATIAVAAENVGIASHLLEMTIEYTSSRKQFGRAIASYQAIKHRIADMLLDVERARSAARYAAGVVDADGDRDAIAFAAAIAGTICAEAAMRVCTETIQLHGGIGFTWEHPAHNYYRRVLVNEAAAGDATTQRARIASSILDRVPESA
ncbi:UNVERIFIED_ORG: acyl-CoA dehydrogenase [Gordonia westfalica J30]